jgi:hypothetical protein
MRTEWKRTTIAGATFALSLSSVLDNSGRGMVKRAVGTMNFNVDIPS